MDWKKEALVRARRARLQANNLRRSINGLVYSLDRLGDYDEQSTWPEDTTKIIEGIIKDLFDIEGELSRPA